MRHLTIGVVLFAVLAHGCAGSREYLGTWRLSRSSPAGAAVGAWTYRFNPDRSGALTGPGGAVYPLHWNEDEGKLRIYFVPGPITKQQNWDVRYFWKPGDGTENLTLQLTDGTHDPIVKAGKLEFERLH